MGWFGYWLLWDNDICLLFRVRLLSAFCSICAVGFGVAFLRLSCVC